LPSQAKQFLQFVFLLEQPASLVAVVAFGTSLKRP
jgi:hypothetical protein